MPKKHESAQLSAVAIWFLLLGNCADTIEIYMADRDLTALSNPRAIPTRQIYKPRYARRAFGPPRFQPRCQFLSPLSPLSLRKAQVTQALWEIYRPCDLCSALCECCNMSVTAAVT